MSVEKVRAHLVRFGLEDRIHEFEVSSATVELAAAALQCEPARIAKTLSFHVGERVALVVLAGDARVDSRKFKATFGCKVKFLSAEQAEDLVGYGIGGVCPFDVNDGCDVYLDESLRRFQVVYTGGGSENCMVELSLEELERCAAPCSWVDVGKLPEAE